MAIDWKLEISALFLVKREIIKVDRTKLWPQHLPRLAATRDEIRELEEHLGFRLPEIYADFLMHANGWVNFYQHADLFGTKDHLGSEIQRSALEGLKYCRLDGEDSAPRNLVPIAASKDDMDIFCLHKETGEIVWLAGGEIERFPDFGEYFLAMIDYNREDLADLEKEAEEFR